MVVKYPFTSAAALPLHHTFLGSIASSSANSVCSSWPFLLPILSALIDVSNLGQVLLELDKWRRGEEAKQSPLLRLTRLIGVNLLGGREGRVLAPCCRDCVVVWEQTGPRQKLPPSLQGRWMKKGSFQTWTGRVSGDGSGQAASKLYRGKWGGSEK